VKAGIGRCLIGMYIKYRSAIQKGVVGEYVMSEEIKKLANALFSLYHTGIENIAEWNEHLPAMQQTRTNLDWIRSSMNDSPQEIATFTDEIFLDYLDKAAEGADILRSIPSPSPEFYPIVTTSGSVLPSIYNQYVRKVANQYQSNPDVVEWAGITIAFGEELQEEQNRSDLVHQRLTLLRADLADLHREATDMCLKAQAECDSKPVGAAMILNRLLEQFKGALINNCRGGDGIRYQRISDYLAANSTLTKTVVIDGQYTYDRINKELVQIRKRMQVSSGDRVVEILREIEDHIIIITDALDPTKLGISFT
jgi:hypothetical protein